MGMAVGLFIRVVGTGEEAVDEASESVRSSMSPLELPLRYL